MRIPTEGKKEGYIIGLAKEIYIYIHTHTHTHKISHKNSGEVKEVFFLSEHADRLNLVNQSLASRQ
jgi:hypothetical protein